MGLEVVVGFLVAWAIAKGRRVAERADGIIDETLDAGVDRVRALVSSKLDGDPSLERLATEATTGTVTDRTTTRVRLALEEAVEQDPEFATRLLEAVRAASPQVQSGAGQSVSGTVEGSNVQVGGNVGGAIWIHNPER
ncbi:chromosome partitioning protein [Actinokineospora terrae]|uniref:Chromosome partitioning protein n=1 Tax=Actinokineospora terrae TaxID=155974 RepID=A0A1H9T1U3_9PSEU|nr:chromosome partitioning protein [Actinokineospora terrae]SER90603.1 hypothetical protein SAMN04487818_1065 [Actinokineospora terrae]